MDTGARSIASPGEESQAGGSRRGCAIWIVVLLVLVAGGGLTAYIAATSALRQNSVFEPEAAAADLGKRWVMVPSEFVDWRMPADIANSAQALNSGRELFNTQCAMCHGLNAKGPKPGDLGAAMFPPAVPLDRDRTQSKTDGQLYYMIFHGINYTGMPAWGSDNDKNGVRNGPNDQAEIWSLVRFIRSLQSK